MAKRTKREKKIDVNVKLKKNELSLAFMKAYISEKVEADKLEEAKAEFKKNAIITTENGEPKYDAKKAKDYFATTYPEAIEPPKKKGGNSALDDLNDW